MSSNASSLGNFSPIPTLPEKSFSTKQVSTFRYPATLQPLADMSFMPDEPARLSLAEEELQSRLVQERAAGAAEAMAALRLEFEERAAAEAEKISMSILNFAEESKRYFAQVEVDVVSLALSIAAKILHREAQVDPRLVAALVQMALKQTKEGSTVQVRVRPEEAARWREHFSAMQLHVNVSVVEDATLQANDCVLETELGKANLGIDAQLKEVERGFFDVLAKKPQE